eukprot:6205479-Pleurochrysis_carterae.AAC.1
MIATGEHMEAVAERIKKIRAEAEETDSQFDKEKAEERIAKLGGAIGRIKVARRTFKRAIQHTPVCTLERTRARTQAVARRSAFGARPCEDLCVRVRVRVCVWRVRVRAIARARPARQVGAATETELKDKKLRYEDALNS